MNEETAGTESNPDVEYFQQLADGSPVMIWMSGSDMGCFYFNRAWLEYRGRTLEQEFGEGWAEGVHPDDFERCVQHYTGCFQKRIPFAMSYRLQHHTGEHRWILDRGAPHYAADGEFLGYYGGCAQLSVDAAVPRVVELRQAIEEMRDFALRLATAEAYTLESFSNPGEIFGGKTGFQSQARQHAAAQMEKLAADMLLYDRIDHGACL